MASTSSPSLRRPVPPRAQRRRLPFQNNPQLSPGKRSYAVITRTDVNRKYDFDEDPDNLDRRKFRQLGETLEKELNEITEAERKILSRLDTPSEGGLGEEEIQKLQAIAMRRRQLEDDQQELANKVKDYEQGQELGGEINERIKQLEEDNRVLTNQNLDLKAELGRYSTVKSGISDDIQQNQVVAAIAKGTSDLQRQELLSLERINNALGRADTSNIALVASSIHDQIEERANRLLARTESLDRQLSGLEASKQELEQRLEQRQRDYNEINEALKELRARTEGSAASQLKDLEKARSTAADLQLKLQRAESNVLMSKGDLKAATESESERLTTLRGELATARDAVTLLEDDAARQQAELNSLRSRLEQASAANAQLTKSVQSVNAEIAAANEAKLSAEQRITEVEKQNELLRAQVDAIPTATKESFEQGIASLKAETEDNIKASRREYAIAQGKIKVLEGELKRFRERAIGAERQVSSKSAEIERNERQGARVREELAEATSALSRFMAQDESLEKELSALRATPGVVAKEGRLAGYSFSSDEDDAGKGTRQDNDPEDALLGFRPPPQVSDDSPGLTGSVNTLPLDFDTVSRDDDDLTGGNDSPYLTPATRPVAVTRGREWVRPPPRSSGSKRDVSFDINNFAPNIPEQAAAWAEKLENITKAIKVGSPDRVYRKVQELLQALHPEETEFYHRFYTFIGFVEGACAKSKGTFWKSKDADLEHLAKDIADAASTEIVTIPISEAEFFPLSKDELALGIADELAVYRIPPKYKTVNGRRVEVRVDVDPPTSKLLDPSLLQGEEYRASVEQLQEADFRNRIEKFESILRDPTKSASEKTEAAERLEVARRNQARYAQRNAKAPLQGFSQRWLESKSQGGGLDSTVFGLFNHENALIIPYNFWYFLQDKIISKLNKGHSNYTVEMKNIKDHSWTNILAGHTINDIAYNLADGLWENLQIRSVDGSLKRRPSLFSVMAFLNKISIDRIANQMEYINSNYKQTWQDRLVSLLQTAVDANVYNSFVTALGLVKRRFDIYDPKLNEYLQNIAFANLVGAIYQKNVVDNRVGTTGIQLRSASAKVSACIDIFKRTIGLSTKSDFYAPPPPLSIPRNSSISISAIMQNEREGRVTSDDTGSISIFDV